MFQSCENKHAAMQMLKKKSTINWFSYSIIVSYFDLGEDNTTNPDAQSRHGDTMWRKEV